MMGASAQAPMPPEAMMGLFGLISGLAKKERSLPMDDMRKAIELLESIRERDPERTGLNATMAIDILRNGPEGLQNREEAF